MTVADEAGGRSDGAGGALAVGPRPTSTAVANAGVVVTSAVTAACRLVARREKDFAAPDAFVGAGAVASLAPAACRFFFLWPTRAQAGGGVRQRAAAFTRAKRVGGGGAGQLVEVKLVAFVTLPPLVALAVHGIVVVKVSVLNLIITTATFHRWTIILHPPSAPSAAPRARCAHAMAMAAARSASFGDAFARLALKPKVTLAPLCGGANSVPAAGGGAG